MKDLSAGDEADVDSMRFLVRSFFFFFSFFLVC